MFDLPTREDVVEEVAVVARNRSSQLRTPETSASVV